MNTKTSKILEKIEKISVRKVENPELLSNYIEQSLSNKKLITFYNWECPPRFLDKNNEIPFINYDVDLRKILAGKKVDKYTEIPRAVEKHDEEKNILKFLKNIGLNFRFVKIIADTNASYLTPESQKIMNKALIQRRFNEFKKIIEDTTDDYPTKTKVSFFTDLVGNNIGKYEEVFYNTLSALHKNPNSLLDKIVIEKQLERTINHVGIDGKEWLESFTLKTIASYGAEGIIFDIISKRSSTSNCVWLNIEEINERTIIITNFIRKKYKISNLPMIFPDSNVF